LSLFSSRTAALGQAQGAAPATLLARVPSISCSKHRRVKTRCWFS